MKVNYKGYTIMADREKEKDSYGNKKIFYSIISPEDEEIYCAESSVRTVREIINDQKRFIDYYLKERR